MFRLTYLISLVVQNYGLINRICIAVSKSTPKSRSTAERVSLRGGPKLEIGRNVCWAKGWEIIASNPERNKPQTLSLSVNFEPKFETIFEMKFWKKFENFQNQEDISEKGWSILKYFEGFVQPILPYMKPLIRFLSEGMETSRWGNLK